MACDHACSSHGGRNLSQPDPKRGDLSSLLGGAIFQEGEATPHCIHSLSVCLSLSHRYKHTARGAQQSVKTQVPALWPQDGKGEPQGPGRSWRGWEEEGTWENDPLTLVYKPLIWPLSCICEPRLKGRHRLWEMDLEKATAQVPDWPFGAHVGQILTALQSLRKLNRH